jgi:thymidine kinase
MIQIIYGPKGSGKTKQLIELANSQAETATGESVFISDTTRYMFDIKRSVRFIDLKEFNIAGEEAFCGFIKGVIAANRDNEYLYIDGASRITGKPLSEMAGFFYMLERISDKLNLKITIVCSAAKEELPPFIAKYL